MLISDTINSKLTTAPQLLKLQKHTGLVVGWLSKKHLPSTANFKRITSLYFFSWTLQSTYFSQASRWSAQISRLPSVATQYPALKTQWHSIEHADAAILRWPPTVVGVTRGLSLLPQVDFVIHLPSTLVSQELL